MMMFTVKKIFILMITCLFLSSMTVLAAYTPSVPTDWGDFAEKTSVTKEIVGGTEYSFSVLSEKHTFNAIFTQQGGSSPAYPGAKTPTLIRLVFDGTVTTSDGPGGVIYFPSSVQSTGYDQLTYVRTVGGVDVTFSLSGDHITNKGSLTIITPGITQSALKKSLITSAYSSNGVYNLASAKELGTEGYDFILTYSPSYPDVVPFKINGVPLALKFNGVNSLGFSFLSALGEYPTVTQFNTAVQSAKSGVSETKTVQSTDYKREFLLNDNLGGQFIVSIFPQKFYHVNGIAVAKITLRGKNPSKGLVSGNPFVTKAATPSLLDYVDQSISTYVLMSNSIPSWKLYGPLKVGSMTYYVQQFFDVAKSEFRLVAREDKFLGGNITAGPFKIKQQFIYPSSQVGVSAIGSSVGFKLWDGTKSVTVYFVPLELNPSASKYCTGSGADGAICFFVGGEKAYKLAFPTLEAGVYTPPSSGLPSGTGLGDQQLPAGTGTQQAGGVGVCQGKSNGQVLVSTEPNKYVTLCANGFPEDCNDAHVNTVRFAGTVAFLCQHIKVPLQYVWIECNAANDGTLSGSPQGYYGAGAYTKNFLCGVDIENGKTYEKWYSCPLKTYDIPYDTNTVTEKEGYVCYNNEWTLKSKVPLEGDLNADGFVNKDDITWIKNNPKLMWEEKLKKNMSSLNALISAMVKNWS